MVMKKKDLLKNHVQKIVEEAYNKKNDSNLKIDYVIMYAKTDWEYSGLWQIAKQFGELIEHNEFESIYRIEPLETVAGNLEILRIFKENDNNPEDSEVYFKP